MILQAKTKCEKAYILGGIIAALLTLAGSVVPKKQNKKSNLSQAKYTKTTISYYYFPPDPCNPAILLLMPKSNQLIYFWHDETESIKEHNARREIELSTFIQADVNQE